MRILFSILGIVLLSSGAFAQNLDLQDQASCIATAEMDCSDSPEERGDETSSLDRALRGVMNIGRGAAEIGRAAVDAADERAPEVMDAGRNLMGQASGFFEATRDRVRLLMSEDAP